MIEIRTSKALSNVYSEISLGSFEGISINLISPFSTADGSVYYFLDSDGNGAPVSEWVSGVLVSDAVHHDLLDDFLNEGLDTTDSNRTAQLGEFLLTLPTKDELVDISTEVIAEKGGVWPNGTYWSSTRAGVDEHYRVGVNDSGRASPASDKLESTVTGNVTFSVSSLMQASVYFRGETLYTYSTEILNTDELDSLTYVWLRDGVRIIGANRSDYELTQADVGKQISVEVSYTDGFGSTERVTSESLAAITAPARETMATVRAFGPSDMENRSVLFGEVTSYSSNHITITIGGDSATYRGNFTFDSAGQVFGEITSYEAIYSGAPAFTVNGLDLDAFQTFLATQAGNAIGILESAFRGDDDIFGSSGSDTLAGYAGHDILIGGHGNDSLVGGIGNDTLMGDGGADALTGSAGNDLLDGGADIDQARYSGAQTSYTLGLSPHSTTITDRRLGGNGTDQLIDIEFLDFDEWAFPYKFDLTTVGGTAKLSQQNFESLIELYIAYFNRAPDAVGLNFWGTAFANGFTLEQIALGFIDQDETRAAYPESLSNEDFATVVYGNVLGRIPDQTGFDFWVGALDSGGVSRDQFILSVLGGAKVDPPVDATQEFIDQQILDRAYLETKTDIGAYFAVHKGMSDVDNATAAMGFFNGTAPSVISVIDAIDGFYADALDPNNGEFLMQLVGVLDDPFV